MSAKIVKNLDERFDLLISFDQLKEPFDRKTLQFMRERNIISLREIFSCMNLSTCINIALNFVVYYLTLDVINFSHCVKKKA